jgi:hypothetical protein
MSYMKASGVVAAAVTALALSATAYGDGKSPNGAPGPAGNPNQPAAQPQANGPQGPAGNDGQANKAAPKAKSHGKSGASHGKSGQSHGKSQAQSHGKSGASHGNSQSKSHANPNVGTPRKGGREDRPADKITICHATKSHTNPYVEITISMNGLHGHGPAEDPHHHAGSWKDIIPAPAAGCPGTVQAEQKTKTKTEQPVTQQSTEVAKFVATTPEVAVIAPAAEAAPQQAVLGVQAQGTSPASEDEDATAPGQSKVLGASASGTTAPKAALAARAADNDDSGSLPFTGFELAFVLLAAAAALLGGFALRRATAHGRS